MGRVSQLIKWNHILTVNIWLCFLERWVMFQKDVMPQYRLICLSKVALYLWQLMSSILHCLFLSSSGNTLLSYSSSAAQSLIFRLLLGGTEMNSERENWSPSVTTGVADALNATGHWLPRDQIDLSAWNVCVPGNLLFGWSTAPSRWDPLLQLAHICVGDVFYTQTL